MQNHSTRTVALKYLALYDPRPVPYRAWQAYVISQHAVGRTTFSTNVKRLRDAGLVCKIKLPTPDIDGSRDAYILTDTGRIAVGKAPIPIPAPKPTPRVIRCSCCGKQIIVT